MIPSEREAPCRVHAACGGCSFMLALEEAQRERKRVWVSRLLGVDVSAVVPSPRSVQYRARVRFRVGPSGALGYHRPRSHEWVAIDHCLLARPELDTLRAALGPVAKTTKAVELRTDGTTAVAVLDGRRAVGAGGEASDGLLFVDAGAGRLRVSARSFFQINLEVNRLLVEYVRGEIASLKPERVADLYAGVGNFAVPLARDGWTVHAVEESADAVRDLRANAAGVESRLEARVAKVESLSPGDVFFDVALLDPPRSGCPGVVERLLKTRPKALVLVSCHPPNLVGDVRCAAAEGYELRSVRLFDMFPQTEHVEAVVVLERSTRPGRSQAPPSASAHRR